MHAWLKGLWVDAPAAVHGLDNHSCSCARILAFQAPSDDVLQHRR